MSDQHLPPEQRSIPTGGFGRATRMFSVPLQAAGRAGVGMGRRLLGADKEEVDAQMRQQAAEQMFRVLGELKGGAMKFGQALSMFETVLPEDVAGPYREQLRRLQDSAPPMPASRVESVMAVELGPRWRTLFSSFERHPAAAASIGQVHKAVWRETGTPVAVKIQYPGADLALKSDLAQINRLATAMSPLTGGMDLKEMTAEIGARISEEVDYLHEASMQARAAAAFAGHPDFVVPRVFTATSKVVVSEWLTGTSLNAAADMPDEARNRIGLSYVRFLFAGPSIAGLLHSDPHPGNFLILDDGRLGVVDWGLTAEMPNGLPRAMGRLIRLALHGDAPTVAAGLVAEGLLTRDVDATELLDYLEPFVEPARSEDFHFTREWMRGQFARIHAESRGGRDSIMYKLNVPADYALIHRVWLGGIAVLSQLDVRARFADVLSEFLPGFAAES